jgi:hypothetical protein
MMAWLKKNPKERIELSLKNERLPGWPFKLHNDSPIFCYCGRCRVGFAGQTHQQNSDKA